MTNQTQNPNNKKPAPRWIQSRFIIALLLFSFFVLHFSFYTPPARAAAVINKLPSSLGLATNLVGHWTMDGKDINWTANTMTDKSGNGNTGTLTNMSTTTSPTIGKIGQGLKFDGVNDFIASGDIDVSDITVSAWIKANGWGDGGIGTIISKSGAFVFSIDDGTIGVDTLIFYVGGEWEAATASGIALWYCGFVTATANSTTVTFYINGVQAGSNVGTHTLGSNNNNVQIGKYDSSLWEFNGTIDEVKMYNRALSAQEAKQLYGAGQAKVKPVGPVDESLPANAFVAYVRENCTGYSPCYNTLSAWEAAAGGITYGACATGDLVCADKVAVAKIDGSWTSPDTAAVTISGWTTDATRYIKIYTTPSARHDGKWNTTKYHRTETITVSEEYVRIDGLQSQVTGSARGYFVYGSTGTGEIHISNAYVDTALIAYDIYTVGALTVRIWNSISISTTNNGFYLNDAEATLYCYNCTGYVSGSVGYAFRQSAGTGILVNALGYAPGTGGSFTGTWSSVTYSASDDANADDWGGTGNRINQTFSFVNIASKNFHLVTTDTGARDFGTSNPGSGLFLNDIDGQARSGKWDIGADENNVTVVNTSPTTKLTSGLVGYWTFDGKDINWTANTTTDKSGNSNTGTLTNMSTTTSPTIGKIGQGLRFDASNDCVNAGSGSSLDNLDTKGGLSVSAWIYPNSMGSSGHIINKDLNAVGFWYFLQSGSNLRFIKDGSTDLTVHSSGGLSAKQWQHVAVAWDGSTTATNVHIYVNGVETSYATQTNGDSLVSDASSNLLIGGRTAANCTTVFDGLIDEVRLYNRVMSQSEIKQLYNMGR